MASVDSDEAQRLVQGDAAGSASPAARRLAPVAALAFVVGLVFGSGAILAASPSARERVLPFVSPPPVLASKSNVTAKTKMKAMSCPTATARYGSMTAIGNWTYGKSKPFPNVTSETAYALISQCVTMLPVCIPSKLKGSSAIRKMYPSIVGTAVAELYLQRLSDKALMQELFNTQGVGESIFGRRLQSDCDFACFEKTRHMLAQEVALLQQVGEWYSIYGQYFKAMNDQLDEAFAVAQNALMMTTDTTVTAKSPSKKKFFLTLCDAVGNMLLVMSGIGDVAIAEEEEVEVMSEEEQERTDADEFRLDDDLTDEDAITEDGSAQEEEEKAEAKRKCFLCTSAKRKDSLIKGTLAIGASLVAIPALVEDGEEEKERRETIDANKGKRRRLGSDGSQDDVVALNVGTYLTELKAYLQDVMVGLISQAALITTDWGRLAAAGALAAACPLNTMTVAAEIEKTFPAMTWIALGVLMPSKYAIYWQRNYGPLGFAGQTEGKSCTDGNDDECEKGEACGVDPVSTTGYRCCKNYNVPKGGAATCLSTEDMPGVEVLGPECFYNGYDKSTSSDQGCSTSESDQCYYPTPSPFDASDFFAMGSKGKHKFTTVDIKCVPGSAQGLGVDEGAGTACASNERQMCDLAIRAVWVAEIGDPSALPSSTFWDALVGAGPVATYVNPVYNKSYTSGRSPFVEQCSYMSKVYVPPVGETVRTNEWEVEYSAIQYTPSNVSVPCNVFGILMPTYAFADCNTNKQWGDYEGVCVNGQGNGETFNDNGANYHATGNFNQFTYVPKTAGHWSTFTDGYVGCCKPWLLPDQVNMNRGDGCELALCDCWSITEASEHGFITDQAMDAWLQSCSVQTDNFTVPQMITTSAGSGWDWLQVLSSGGSLPGLNTSASAVE